MAAYSPGGSSSIPVYGAGFTQQQQQNQLSPLPQYTMPGISPNNMPSPMSAAGSTPILFAGNPSGIPAGNAGRGIPQFTAVNTQLGGGQVQGLPTLPANFKPGASPYPVLMTPNGPAYIMSVSPLNPSTLMGQSRPQAGSMSKKESKE